MPSMNKPELFFHSHHTWAKLVAPNRIRVGLDAMAVELLGRGLSLIFPSLDSHLVKNEPGAWWSDEAGPIPIKMPVSGQLRRINPLVLQRPALVSEDPYECGWLLEAYCENADEQLQALIPEEDFQERIEKDRSDFLAKIRREMARAKHAVGQTMADGGVRLRDLRSMIGPPLYRKLLIDLL
jgi:glycine cleavage system H lipoate-binding protein